MLTRGQQITLKRAQKEAALDDNDYRDTIALVSGMADCRSSTDARLTDDHMDSFMSYVEAIFWREVDAGRLQPSFKPNAVFRQRDYWKNKNRRGDTSRDRYTGESIKREIADLEARLQAHGCGFGYFQAIQNNMKRGGKEFTLVKYAGALRRTLEAKERAVDQPF